MVWVLFLGSSRPACFRKQEIWYISGSGQFSWSIFYKVKDKVTSAEANIFFSGWHENFFAGSTGFSGSAQFMCFTPTIL